MNTNPSFSIAQQTQRSTSKSNKVLRSTYALLSVTLFFSAIMSTVAIAYKVPPLGLLVTLGGYLALLFATHKTRNSGWGIVCVFALTGFMGFTLGPLVGSYWSMAPAVVMQALATTALAFGGLSAYALVSKKDFSFLRGFLFSGIIIAFIAGLAAFFFSIPALSLAVSAMFVVLMSGLILFETSNIIRGGETNYVMATVTLFVALFNLFTSLLQLIGFAQSD